MPLPNLKQVLEYPSTKTLSFTMHPWRAMREGAHVTGQIGNFMSSFGRRRESVPDLEIRHMCRLFEHACMAVGVDRDDFDVFLANVRSDNYQAIHDLLQNAIGQNGGYNEAKVLERRFIDGQASEFIPALRRLVTTEAPEIEIDVSQRPAHSPQVHSREPSSSSALMAHAMPPARSSYSSGPSLQVVLDNAPPAYHRSPAAHPVCVLSKDGEEPAPQGASMGHP